MAQIQLNGRANILFFQYFPQINSFNKPSRINFEPNKPINYEKTMCSHKLRTCLSKYTYMILLKIKLIYRKTPL